jgi:hypothetical protein
MDKQQALFSYILHPDRYSLFASGWVVMQARDREARLQLTKEITHEPGIRILV